jgi:hypothetical protein
MKIKPEDLGEAITKTRNLCESLNDFIFHKSLSVSLEKYYFSDYFKKMIRDIEFIYECCEELYDFKEYLKNCKDLAEKKEEREGREFINDNRLRMEDLIQGGR